MLSRSDLSWRAVEHWLAGWCWWSGAASTTGSAPCNQTMHQLISSYPSADSNGIAHAADATGRPYCYLRETIWANWTLMTTSQGNAARWRSESNCDISVYSWRLIKYTSYRQYYVYHITSRKYVERVHQAIMTRSSFTISLLKLKPSLKQRLEIKSCIYIFLFFF